MKEQITEDDNGNINWVKDGVLVVNRPFYGAEKVLMSQRDELLIAIESALVYITADTHANRKARRILETAKDVYATKD